jgi:hypothetical protein
MRRTDDEIPSLLKRYQATIWKSLVGLQTLSVEYPSNGHAASLMQAHDLRGLSPPQSQ